MIARWRKMGKAYRLTDEYSTLWVRKIGRSWHLLYRHREGWGTLGVYVTLRDAQTEGTALMGEVTG